MFSLTRSCLGAGKSSIVTSGGTAARLDDYEQTNVGVTGVDAHAAGSPVMGAPNAPPRRHGVT